MTRDEIIEVVTSFEYVWDLARSHGVDPVIQDVLRFTFEDLMLAASIYGGEIQEINCDGDVLHALRLDKVTLVS